MRIIAGSYRSRVLAAPPGMDTRPTSDRLRETLFNVLAPRIQSASFLDLYAGSGAVGIEALSRGAVHVTFVERSPAALKVLRGNLARLGIGSGFRVHPGSVSAFLHDDLESRVQSQNGTKCFFSILPTTPCRNMRLRSRCSEVKLSGFSRPVRS